MAAMKIIMATIHLESSTRAVPLAAACLKAMVENHEVLLENYYLEQSVQSIGSSLLAQDPEVVGFPVYLWNRTLVIDVIAYLKQDNPALIVLAGGPEVTAAPGRFLENSGADVAMQGEGEMMIRPLLDALSKGDPVPETDGLWTRNYKPSRAAFCPDFNSLVSPLLSGALDLSANQGLLWELSRGCPFACDFCFESKGAKKVRSLSLDRIEQELALIRDAGIEQVFVLDPTFNTDKKRVLAILDLIREYTPNTYYYFEIRSEFLDDETAEAFSTILCTLQSGLQSWNPDVLINVNRRFDPEEFRRKMDLLSCNQVSFGLDLIYGLPGESYTGFRDSLNYALSLEPNHLDLFPLSVLPGTVLYDKGEQLGLHHLPEDPYRVTYTDSMTVEDLAKAAELAEGADELYNAGKAVSWFTRICRDMEAEPAGIMDDWIRFRHGKEIYLENLTEKILLFLEELYKNRKMEREYQVIRDLIHFLSIQEFIEEQAVTSETPEEGILLEDSLRICLHPTVRIETFSLSPGLFPEVLEEQTSGIVPFQSSLEMSWIFWSRDWELFFEELNQEEKELLDILQDPVSIGHLRSGKKDRDRVDQFLLESLLEGYVTLV